MWSKVVLMALGASLVPLGACAQSRDDAGGPPPEMRAKLDAARGAAKDASFAALTPDHRAQVQALVDAFDASGSTATVSDTASKIDAVLTKDEAAAVLTQEQKMHDSMRAAYEGGGAGGPGGPGGPDGNGPSGAGPGGTPAGGPGGQSGMSGAPGAPGGGFGFGGGRSARRRVPDAGRFLLQIDASQDRFHEAMRAERGMKPGS